MKEEEKNQPEITNETKNEMQELFDELFVGSINSQMKNITEKSQEVSEQIDRIQKDAKNQLVVISESLDKINKSVACLGEEEEWDDQTIITFLNEYSKMIAECKDEIEIRTKCLEGDWEDDTLRTVLSRIELQENKTEDLINKIYGEKLGHDYEVLCHDIKLINDISEKVSITQEEIQAKIDTLNSGLDDAREKLSLEIENQNARNLEIEKKYDNKLKNIISGIGILAVFDIIMIIIMFIK